MADRLKILRRKLYLMARERVPVMHKEDDEIVRIVRDNLIKEVYPKVEHEKLNEYQLSRVISCAEAIKQPNEPGRDKPATQRQLNLLKFYAMKCALQYADWESASFDVDGVKLSGAALKERIEFLFLGRQNLPKSVIAFMFSNWINAKCNELLVQAGFKHHAKHQNKIVYEYLKDKEAKALVTRFMKISEALFVREPLKLTYN